MPVPTRPTKPSSGTNAFVTGTVIDATEMNDDFNTLYAGFAALDNANMAAAADIDPSKIGDYAASDTEFKTVSDPGSGGSLTLPTDLEGELASLRYAIERLAIGVDGSTHTKRYNGTSNVDCSWLDYPARPVNLATNHSFEYKSSAVATDAPDGWALHDDPASITLAATDASEGSGNMVTIVTDAATEGIKQTFSNLKPSTRYLVSVRAKSSDGIKTARMLTENADATSAFRDITLDRTSATFGTLRAIIQTDGTPTDIVVYLMGVENAATVSFDHFALQECSKEISYPSTASYNVRSVLSTEKQITDAVNFEATGLSCTVSAPSSGMRFEITGNVNIWSTTAASCYVAIFEDATEVFRTIAYDHHTIFKCVPLRYVKSSPTPNTSYVYTIKALIISGDCYINKTPATYHLNSSLDVSVI